MQANVTNRCVHGCTYVILRRAAYLKVSTDCKSPWVGKSVAVHAGLDPGGGGGGGGGLRGLKPPPPPPS